MSEQISNAWQGLRSWANEHTAHSIPLFFCLLSLQNIQEFFFMLHPNVYISWAAGLALGFGLLRQAVKLSDMEWNMQDRKYMTVLYTTVAFAVVSGGIQAAAYSQYMHWIFAIPVGLALPTLATYPATPLALRRPPLPGMSWHEAPTRPPCILRVAWAAVGPGGVARVLGYDYPVPAVPQCCASGGADQ